MRYAVAVIVVCVLLNGRGISRATEWSDIWALGQAGLAAGSKKDYETARRNFDAAVQMHPKVAVAYANRGAFFFENRDYALALKDFDTAVRLRPTVWAYFILRGLTYAKLGKYGLALADFNLILSRRPLSDDGRAELLHDRAWIEATCPDARYRNGKQAIEDAKIAVRFTWSGKASYLATLAAAYAEAGDFNSAIKYQEKAITAQTKTDKLGDADGALKAYRQHRPYRDYPSKEKNAPKG